MKTTPKHTPGPWHATGTQIIGTSGRRHQYIADVGGDVETEAARANAEFICRACNSHDELLVACRRLLDLWEEAIDHEEDYMAMVNFARDAIAKAEGRGE